MSWHHIPKDDAWKEAHLAMLVRSEIWAAVAGGEDKFAVDHRRLAAKGRQSLPQERQPLGRL